MDFLPTLKQFVLAYQAFERYSAVHLKSMGLTMTQFDVIATLGNRPPMTCKDLGERTLVTKGTLTGVLERLEQKGLIRRELNPDDARSQMIGLTTNGQKMFERVFPKHIRHLGDAFEKLTTKELRQMQELLPKFKNIF